MSKSIVRRDLWKMGMAAAAFLAVEKSFPRNAYAAVPAISLEKCLSMTPEQMAASSGRVDAAWQYILAGADELRNPELKAKVTNFGEKYGCSIRYRDAEKGRSAQGRRKNGSSRV